MEEKLTLSLNCEQIENLLFEHYFGNSESKEQIEKTLKMDCKITNRKSICTTITDITFILSYQEQNETLGIIIKKLIVGLKDLNDIINEKFSTQGFEIDYLEENIKFFEGKHSLNYIEYNLKRKEEVKMKKRGWKRHV